VTTGVWKIATTALRLNGFAALLQPKEGANQKALGIRRRAMAEKVLKLNIERDYKNWMYFIDGFGSVCKMPKRGGATIELHPEAVKREDGFLYFIDKDGDISRAARGAKPIR
jgi:hypothetical protein